MRDAGAFFIAIGIIATGFGCIFWPLFPFGLILLFLGIGFTIAYNTSPQAKHEFEQKLQAARIRKEQSSVIEAEKQAKRKAERQVAEQERLTRAIQWEKQRPARQAARREHIQQYRHIYQWIVLPVGCVVAGIVFGAAYSAGYGIKGDYGILVGGLIGAIVGGLSGTAWYLSSR